MKRHSGEVDISFHRGKSTCAEGKARVLYRAVPGHDAPTMFSRCHHSDSSSVYYCTAWTPSCSSWRLKPLPLQPIPIGRKRSHLSPVVVAKDENATATTTATRTRTNNILGRATKDAPAQRRRRRRIQTLYFSFSSSSFFVQMDLN